MTILLPPRLLPLGLTMQQCGCIAAEHASHADVSASHAAVAVTR